MSVSEAQFESILLEIKGQNWSSADWAGHEADDWFQSENFIGGFEANESYKDGEFSFAYYDTSGKEWWFSFTLLEVESLLDKGFAAIELTAI